MSGGAAVKAGGGVEGDRPVCTTSPPPKANGEGGHEQKPEEDRGYAPRRP
jgi:hypothetical protein